MVRKTRMRVVFPADQEPRSANGALAAQLSVYTPALATDRSIKGILWRCCRTHRVICPELSSSMAIEVRFYSDNLHGGALLA
jgi:hypothetical protein